MVESGRKRWFFPDAFKLEAVAAVRGGGSAARSRPNWGCPIGWCALGCARRKDAGWLGAARRRRELDRMRMEGDILKRAALILDQATGRR